MTSNMYIGCLDLEEQRRRELTSVPAAKGYLDQQLDVITIKMSTGLTRADWKSIGHKQDLDVGPHVDDWRITPHS